MKVQLRTYFQMLQKLNEEQERSKSTVLLQKAAEFLVKTKSFYR